MKLRNRRLVALVLSCSLVASENCATVKPYRLTNYFRSSKVGTEAVRRLAVLPFENLTPEPAAASIVADEFSLQVGKTGLFDLLERNRLEELWREQDLDTLFRFDQASAVKVGRMLGAQAVVLGSVTEFRPHPDVKLDESSARSRSADPENTAPVVFIGDKHSRDVWELIVVSLAALTVIGAVVLLLRPKPAAAKVGLSVRIVEVETGEVIWQAKDSFRGDQRSVQALVDQSEDRKRMVYDVEYLTRILCRELAGALVGQ